MRRREFVTGLGGAAAWPLAARAQQPATPVIGFLRSTSSIDSAALVAAFRRGLSEARLIEGQNVGIEFRFADGNLDRLPALVADLVRRRVAVIIANQTSTPTVIAATKSIPVVFVIAGDPVQQGLVASLSRPGGNVTGISFMNNLLGEKRLGLLHELVPKAGIIGALLDRNAPEREVESRDFEVAARAVGRELLIADAATEGDFNPAFATLAQSGAGALLVGASAFILSHRRQIAALANRHGLPALYSAREFVEVGGLMS